MDMGHPRKPTRTLAICLLVTHVVLLAKVLLGANWSRISHLQTALLILALVGLTGVVLATLFQAFVSLQ